MRAARGAPNEFKIILGEDSIIPLEYIDANGGLAFRINVYTDNSPPQFFKRPTNAPCSFEELQTATHLCLSYALPHLGPYLTAVNEPREVSTSSARSAMQVLGENSKGLFGLRR